ncbi:retron Eco8 family effector endonuclease [Vibrio algarum]|uniref:Retron Eco8 family effector endonuclease n=1 Tax=Vibrio algarum TaxID=3020714 RepID=A0ABT4YPC2_9VIBR|nr:retron Eco8 family effector endonuclease [Vibrio sp. KJ40-1]MDB1123399.1 retron Eco8 family effector endonuclease [Vibrio sp. KJ40-1]
MRVHKNNSLTWSDSDSAVREIIHRIYPFFSIDTRRLDLYDWKYLWNVVTKLKFLNTKHLTRDKIIEFIDQNVSNKSNSYKDYVETIGTITKATPYEYQDLLLNYIKVGLRGHKFNIDGFDLVTQSDGTNSHKFLEIFLNLLITLTRREFITPTIFIDEPEIGLHPKRSEELIDNLHQLYRSLKSDSSEWERGKYKTPYPKIIFSTHSPNVLKTIVKQFNNTDEHKVYHFTSVNNKITYCSLMNSYFEDSRFVNVFNDNEARLFFSNFILFVEGETELELFGNLNLRRLFPKLNKIDVYKTNEVMLKAINPSNSNVSIPYLVLYDADKMIDINPNTGAISFLSKEVNIRSIRDKYKKGFWGSTRRDYYVRLNNILKIDGIPHEFNGFKTSFKNTDIVRLVNRINNVITKSERVKIAPNTIEGYLLNTNSIKLFVRWLLTEFDKHVQVGSKGDPNRVIDSHRNRYPQNFNVISSFNAIFNQNISDIELSNDNKNFAKLVKEKYLRYILREFVKLNITKEDKVIIFRIAFEGKSDTLCSKENKNYKQLIDQTARDLVLIIKDRIIDKLPYGGSKTGGWVSNFLDFALTEIKTSSENDVEAVLTFKRTFPDLYSTIEEVSSSID